MNIRVFHYNMLTKDERNRLNGPNGGWDSDPRFTRYANISCSADHAAIREGWKRNEYTAVANVKSDDLEDAFHLTNHIEDSWTDNRDGKVEVVGTDPKRSSSVGDIFEKDGKFYAVEGVGFSEINLS